MTNYKVYYATNDDCNEVIYVQEGKAKLYVGEKSGYLDDIDLYEANDEGSAATESIVKKLKNYYKENSANMNDYNNMHCNGDEYNFTDIENDYEYIELIFDSNNA